MRVSCKDPKSFGEKQKEALEALVVGTICSGTVVEKSDDDLIIEIGSGLKGVLAIGHLTDGSREKSGNTLKKLRAGQTLSDLVILDKNIDRRLIVFTMKPSLVQAAKSKELLGAFEDVSKGKVVKGWVKNITLIGVFVSFAGGVTGLVLKKDLPAEVQSLPDFKYIKYQSITTRVETIDFGGRRFRLSLRLGEEPGAGGVVPAAVVPVKPVDENITSLADLIPGTVTKATIISVQQTQINVKLADNIQGRIDVSQLFDSWEAIKNKKIPLECFKKGDVIPVKVLGIHDARNHRFLPITHKASNTKTPIFELSAKHSVIKKEGADVLTITQVTKGSSWVGFVNNLAEDCAWVNISPDIRGRISKLDLSEDISQLNNPVDSFPIGSALKVYVLNVDTQHNKLDLSARSSSSLSLTYEKLRPGMVIPGRVTKVTDRQVIVQLSNSVSGTIDLIDLMDDFSKAKLSRYLKNDVIRVYILKVDTAHKRVTLSTRPSKVLSSELPVRDSQIRRIEDVKPGQLRRGFVKNVSDKGLFISLGSNFTGWVKILNLADTFLKDWKSLFLVGQLVEGKVLSVKGGVGHIEMTLRPSVVSGKSRRTRFGNLKEGQVVSGKVKVVMEYGVFIEVDNATDVSGLCHRSEIADGVVQDVSKLYAVGDPVKAKVLRVDSETGRLNFGLKASYFANEDSEDDGSEGGVVLDGSVSEEDESVGGSDDINLKDVKACIRSLSMRILLTIFTGL